MSFKIRGFGALPQEADAPAPEKEMPQPAEPRKSVVQVHFPGRDMDLAYYNDRFDLNPGDRVYVDGKLEGQLGQVTSVTYNFKIKLSQYQRVIARVDTEVHGSFFMAGSYFLTFDPQALPARQAAGWFRAPEKSDEEYASGTDNSGFRLEDMKDWKVTQSVADRGHEYYLEDRVRYLCLDDTKGYAIVQGTQNYIVEFAYRDGEIRNLTCDCFCSYPCKHEVAVMFQLRDILKTIDESCRETFEKTRYFAAVAKDTLFAFTMDGKKGGNIQL